ncbi:MAG: hypothetical protein Pars2KO_26350 [Parasphingorhabdus sp.]
MPCFENDDPIAADSPWAQRTTQDNKQCANVTWLRKIQNRRKQNGLDIYTHLEGDAESKPTFVAEGAMPYKLLVYSKSSIFSALIDDMVEENSSIRIIGFCKTEEELFRKMDSILIDKIVIDEIDAPDVTLDLIQRIRKFSEKKILCVTTNLVKGARIRKQATELGEVQYFGKTDFYNLREQGELTDLLDYMTSIPCIATSDHSEIQTKNHHTTFSDQGFIIRMTDYSKAAA